MARRTFFSFRYAPDITRAWIVRNAWVRNKVRLVLASVVVSFLGVAYQIQVQAQEQCNSAYAWSPATTSSNTSGPASPPANDTAFNPLGHSYSYFAQGTQSYPVLNVSTESG